MLVSLGVMCSLRGAHVFKTALHIDTDNGAVVLLAIRFSQHVGYEQPQKLYWSFIKSRANKLGMFVSTVEDCVLARLACPVRAKPEEYSMLSMTWKSLGASEREQLTCL